MFGLVSNIRMRRKNESGVGTNTAANLFPDKGF